MNHASADGSLGGLRGLMALAFLVVLSLTLLAGCSSGGGDGAAGGSSGAAASVRLNADPVGTWDTLEMTIDGTKYAGNDLTSRGDFYLNVYENGTSVAVLASQKVAGKWQEEGSGVLTFTYSDGSATMEIDGDQATFSFEDNWSMKLKKASKVREAEGAPATGLQEKQQPQVFTLGSTVTFDGLEIAFGDAISTATLENRFSEHAGQTVIMVPVTITNRTDEVKGLNLFYLKEFGPSGTQLDDVSAYFRDDDAKWAGEMRPGASVTAAIHMLYEGNGTYYIDFRNYSEKVEVEIPVEL